MKETEKLENGLKQTMELLDQAIAEFAEARELADKIVFDLRNNNFTVEALRDDIGDLGRLLDWNFQDDIDWLGEFDAADIAHEADEQDRVAAGDYDRYWHGFTGKEF